MGPHEEWDDVEDQRTPGCDLKLGYTPTVFLAGRRQNIVVYSRCKGEVEWVVADTDDWQGAASNRPNSEGYYSYTLRAKWQHAVTNAEGIRCRFRPLPPEESEPLTLTLEVIVEETRYARPAGGPAVPPLLGLKTLTFVLWAATAVLGLWAIGEILTDIWPTVFIAFTGQMFPGDRRRLYDITATCGLLLLCVAWILVVIGGGEYHRKRIGQPNSWKLFGLTFAVEAVIIIAALFV